MKEVRLMDEAYSQLDKVRTAGKMNMRSSRWKLIYLGMQVLLVLLSVVVLTNTGWNTPSFVKSLVVILMALSVIAFYRLFPSK